MKSSGVLARRKVAINVTWYGRLGFSWLSCRMFRFLAQPYPHDKHNTRRWLITSAGAGLFVALFLVVFQPFGSTEWDDPRKPLFLAGYGLVTFGCMAVVGIVLPALFKKVFDERNWTVGKDIAWTLLLIVSIAFGNLLYSEYVLGTGSGGLLFWIAITAAVGVIPATVITLLNYTRLLRKYAGSDLAVKKPLSEPHLAETLTFLAENEKDELSLAVSDLLFIESADNYSEIVFLQNKETKKTLLRGSLSRFEEQAHHPEVVRCHRSFVVNLQRVESISGNAQGYKLQLTNWTSPVPVARRYGDLVAGYFKK